MRCDESTIISDGVVLNVGTGACDGGGRNGAGDDGICVVDTWGGFVAWGGCDEMVVGLNDDGSASACDVQEGS